MIGLMARRISSPSSSGVTMSWALLADASHAARPAIPRRSSSAAKRASARAGSSRQLAAEADELGVRVVVGGCVALVDAPLPYAPVAAAIDALLRDADDATLLMPHGGDRR